MQVYLNGRMMPEAQALVSLSDRGLLYGDGLFETLRVRGGRPAWWSRHLRRLEEGAAFLRIPVPISAGALRESALELIRANALEESVLRVLLTRGPGRRGYSPRDAGPSTLAMTLHPLPAAPAGLRLISAAIRLCSDDPLRRWKTANRLHSVLARAEAEEKGGDEALVLNAHGAAICAGGGNLFWIERGALATPPLSSGALPGIMRSLVLELVRAQGWNIQELTLTPEELQARAGVFVTNSVLGIAPVASVDGERIASSAPVEAWRASLDRLELAEGLDF